MKPPPPHTRAALVVAHPSHELRVYGWLRAARPLVFVLTDGAGRTGQSRLSETTRILERAGATRGSFYGRHTDLEVYAAILDGRRALFETLAEELAEALARERIEYVVGDAAEGYNTAHDACRLIVDAAVGLARERHGHEVENFDYAVVGPPEEYQPELSDERAIWLRLDPEAFAEKLDAARAYCPDLAADVEAAAVGGSFEGIKHFSEPRTGGAADPVLGAAVAEVLRSRPDLHERLRPAFEGVALDALRVECLRPVDALFDALDKEGPPFYELYGERLVAAGRYSRAIRYREHMLPLAEELRGLAESEELWARSAS